MFRKKGINVCSAFDGLSGAQVALDYLGIPVDKYYSLENDPYAIAITQKNYPETIQLGDIRNVSGDQMPKIDLFVGGFPCQDLSFAGHQKGFQEGTRSSLFFEFLRLLDEIKPTYFLVENTLMNIGLCLFKKKHLYDIITPAFFDTRRSRRRSGQLCVVRECARHRLKVYNMSLETLTNGFLQFLVVTRFSNFH